MRIHAPIIAGLLAVLTTGCQDARPGGLAGADSPLHAELGTEVNVRGGTWERRIPGGTTVASYSGGRIEVRAVSGGTTNLLGQVEADWDPAQSFTPPAGGDIQLTAVAYPGCSFDRWRISGNLITSTSNPITVSSYPGETDFRGEFICVV
jgi:hypothetical protein